MSYSSYQTFSNANRSSNSSSGGGSSSSSSSSSSIRGNNSIYDDTSDIVIIGPSGNGEGEQEGEEENGIGRKLRMNSIESNKASSNDNESLVSLSELVVLNSFVGAYGLIQVSMFMLVLPKECAFLFEGNEAVGLALLMGFAGMTQLICPVAGLFSDRMASPFGRRRPFIVVGTLVALLALSILYYLSSNSSLADPDTLSGTLVGDTLDGSTSTSGGRKHSHNVDSRNLYIIAFVVLNLSLNICFAAYAGLIPDFVQTEQLGEASGIMAVMNGIGSLCGVWLIGFFGVEPFSMYAIWLVICCGLTLVAVKETPLEHSPDPIDCSDVFKVYFEALQDDDFFWVWISRLLYYMGVSVQVYMQFFIRDVIGVNGQDAKMQTALVSIIMLACASLVAVPCGMLSDKVGRKPLVYAASIVMAFVYLGWTCASEMWHILVFSALFGFANGMYLSVDYALGCEAIPDKDEQAAQALGVWGVGAFIGTTIGPLLDGPVLYFVGSIPGNPDRYSHSGYASLLFIGAIFVLSSSAALFNLSDKIGRHHAL